MSPTQAEQPVTVVTKSGPPCPPRTSRATKRGTLGPNEPFLASFWPFPWPGWFQIDCNSDVWAGRSVAMIWTPHTPIFGLKTILAQNWTTKLKKSGQNRPFGALAAEMEAQYIPVSTYNIPYSRQLMDGGHLACWDSIWVVWNVWRTPGAPKRDLLPKMLPLWGPQECRRGLWRGWSTWYGYGSARRISQWQLGQK